MAKMIFVTGGARSGKSRFAEKTCAGFEKKIFVATAQPLDDEMKDRISKHRKSRGTSWHLFDYIDVTPETLGNALRGFDAAVFDCATIHISNLLLNNNSISEDDILHEFDAVAKTFTVVSSVAVIVSNEVGCGIVPDNPLSRRFRDLQGVVNCRLAEIADQAFITVAGIPIQIK